MALPAGRYGVTIEQLRKIRKLPVNTIEMINDTQGGTARVENGAKPEATINAGEQFWHGSILYTATVDIATTDSIVTSGEGANCTPSETITDQLADKLDTYASDPTQWDTTPTANSTKPVTSGGEYNTAVGGYQLVKDTVGWSGKNINKGDSGFVFIKSTARAHNFPFGRNILKDKKYTVSFNVSDISGYNGNSALYVRFISDGISTDDWLIDKNSTGLIEHTFTARENINVDDGSASVYCFIPSSEADNATITVSNFMIRCAEIIDPTYEPYHAPVSTQKCDNSVIAPVEDGANASQAYALNDLFIRDGHLCKTTTAMAQGDEVAGKYTTTSVAEILTAFLNS